MAEQEQTNVNPHVAVLRAAGHEDAARLLEALPVAAPEPSAAQLAGQEPEPQQRPMTPAEVYAAEQQAMGEQLLESLNASVGRNRVTFPAFGGDR